MTIGNAVSTYGSRAVACVVILALYGLARAPEPSADERARLAARFGFHATELPVVEPSTRTVRAVHPSLDHISAWISSVGAAVTLADLDGDGLSNDVIIVDVASDHVVVAPVPGTGDRFSPFTLDAGALVDETMAPMGAIVSDLDENGRADVLVYYWGRTPIAFLAREGAGGPPHPAGFAPCPIAPEARWYTNAATLCDIDGDGHVDLVTGNYFQDGARILDPTAGGTESMQHSMTRAFNGGVNRVLLWAGATGGDAPSVRFVDAGDVFEPDVAHGWTLALGAADLDGDLLPELYFANDFGPDRLLHNRSTPGDVRLVRVEGERRLTTPASKVLGHDSFKGMGVDFGDIDGDGHLDIYVSNIAAEFALEESHFAFVATGEPHRLAEGVAPFVDRSEPLGLSRSSWGWDAKLGDFDNDGTLEAIQATGFIKGDINRWPELQELAIGNDELLARPTSWPRFQPGDDLNGHVHNPFFVRASSGRFVDLAAELGLDRPQVTRGIATGDVDGDGDLDFAVANQWEPSRVYENTAADAGRSLVLRLVLPADGAPSATTRLAGGAADRPVRDAVGATVRVTRPDGTVRVDQVDGGNGHSGVCSREVHVGLGAIGAETVVAVHLAWRDAVGTVRETTLALPPGRHTILLASSAGREPS